MEIKRKIILILSLVLLVSTTSLLLIYFKIDVYCFSLIFPCIILPFISTRLLIDDLQSHYQKNPGALGAFIGAITGVLPVTVLVFSAIIIIFQSRGQTLGGYDVSFIFFISSLVGAWFILMILCTFVGLLASIRKINR